MAEASVASYPVLTVGDGVIEIPKELQSDPRLKKGARLVLVTSEHGPLVLESAEDLDKPKGDWRRLRGALKHLDVRLTDEMEADKQRELAADERMMGGSNK
jgi:hypothetical protein